MYVVNVFIQAHFRVYVGTISLCLPWERARERIKYHFTWYTYEIKVLRYKITLLIIVKSSIKPQFSIQSHYVTYVQNSDNASRNSLISWVTQETNEFRRGNLSIYASQKPSYLRWFTFVFNVLTGQGKTQRQPSNKSTKETTLNLLSGGQLRCCRQKLVLI